MATFVTSKGQITIPKQVRDLMGIGPGRVVNFERGQDGRIVLIKAERNLVLADSPDFATMLERA